MSKSKRRTVQLDPAVAALMSGEAPPKEQAPEPQRKRPRYPSEARRSKATYDLDPETIAKVKEIAMRERFGKKQISVMAQALLDYAIAQYETGAMRIEMVETQEGWKPQAIDGFSDRSE